MNFFVKICFLVNDSPNINNKSQDTQSKLALDKHINTMNDDNKENTDGNLMYRKYFTNGNYFFLFSILMEIFYENILNPKTVAIKNRQYRGFRGILCLHVFDIYPV